MPENTMQNPAAETMRRVFNLAGQGILSHSDLSTVGKLLAEAKNYALEAYLYQTWLKATVSPVSYIVQADLGDALVLLGDRSGAEEAFRQSLAQNGFYERARLSLAKLNP